MENRLTQTIIDGLIAQIEIFGSDSESSVTVLYEGSKITLNFTFENWCVKELKCVKTKHSDKSKDFHVKKMVTLSASQREELVKKITKLKFHVNNRHNPCDSCQSSPESSLSHYEMSIEAGDYDRGIEDSYDDRSIEASLRSTRSLPAGAYINTRKIRPSYLDSGLSGGPAEAGLRFLRSVSGNAATIAGDSGYYSQTPTPIKPDELTPVMSSISIPSSVISELISSESISNQYVLSSESESWLKSCIKPLEEHYPLIYGLMAMLPAEVFKTVLSKQESPVDRLRLFLTLRRTILDLEAKRNKYLEAEGKTYRPGEYLLADKLADLEELIHKELINKEFYKEYFLSDESKQLTQFKRLCHFAGTAATEDEINTVLIKVLKYAQSTRSQLKPDNPESLRNAARQFKLLADLLGVLESSEPVEMVINLLVRLPDSFEHKTLWDGHILSASLAEAQTMFSNQEVKFSAELYRIYRETVEQVLTSFNRTEYNLPELYLYTGQGGADMFSASQFLAAALDLMKCIDVEPIYRRGEKSEHILLIDTSIMRVDRLEIKTKKALLIKVIEGRLKKLKDCRFEFESIISTDTEVDSEIFEAVFLMSILNSFLKVDEFRRRWSAAASRIYRSVFEENEQEM